MSQVRRPEPPPCDLCGLPVTRDAWGLETPERRYAFCCEGCLGIFRLLHDVDPVPSAGDRDRPRFP